MHALEVALVEAIRRPWANTALQDIQDVVEEEGVTIPSFLCNYVSPLDVEKIKQY